MSITSLSRNIYFRNRWKAFDDYTSCGESLQRKVLEKLLYRASRTEYGEKYRFPELKNYEDFAKNVPINDYETLKEYIARMMNGEKDVLWRGKVQWFAKSSGTTDRSKYIPVTQEGLQNLHYAGGKDAISLYLRNHSNSHVLDGKNLVLGGAFEEQTGSKIQRGDISAFLIDKANPLINVVRVPDRSTALLADFERKRDLIARQIINKNITSFSGAPSWMLSVLVRVLELSGKQHLEDIWQNLEVFFHGGMAFTHYREQYNQIISKKDMNYMETYNASEGFFGLQSDPQDNAMLLMIDYDCFYEFIPLNELERENRSAVPLWGVEVGKDYAMMISTSCGLWRYLIGDTIRFTSISPYKFVITGRTKQYINSFGEELMVSNVEEGLSYASNKTGAIIAEYTVAPIFMDSRAKCSHQYLIEFETMPNDMKLFTQMLDEKLKQLNSDYEAKRSKNTILQMPQVVVAHKGLFTAWMKAHNRLGGQHKVPRLSNSREVMDELLSFKE